MVKLKRITHELSPFGDQYRRYVPSLGNKGAIIPEGTPRYFEIGPPDRSSTRDKLDLSLQRLRSAFDVPGVSRVNILTTYVTVEKDPDTPWDEVNEIARNALAARFGQQKDVELFKAGSSQESEVK